MTSKIKVNTVTVESGCTVTLGESGKNVVVANNDIRSNTYKAADGGVIASQCGATITLGASGDTITLASGASQTGFGRTGTVNWQTSSIKTTTFTAANGEGYFANTSGGAFTMNLPAGTAGNIVSVVDYTNSFQTHNLTVTPNGSQKLGGNNARLILNVEGQGLTLVYIDSTVGWRTVQENEFPTPASNYIVATGGTITESGNCRIHTFTGPGSFAVSGTAVCAAENVVSYMVVAGGGGGGQNSQAGGGGAGGYREVQVPTSPYTASPLNGYPTPGNRITISATSYPITVGAGGTPGPTSPGGPNGSPSIFSTITSAGGGYGNQSGANGNPGGSGGGGGENGSGGSGNTPPVTPAQGQNGGSSSNPTGAGGGGAGGTGASGGNPNGGNGGSGTTSSITGSPVTRAGGGGGGGYSPNGQGGSGNGGGGDGGDYGPTYPNSKEGDDATANTGGGGGGNGWPTGCTPGGVGGSGVVIIRYRFQA